MMAKKLAFIAIFVQTTLFIIGLSDAEVLIKNLNSSQIVTQKSLSSSNYNTYCTSSNYYTYCDTNQLCKNNLCRCTPNYKYNYTTQKCEFFQCQFYSECQTDDTNRICSFGSCVCANGYYEDVNKMCTKQSNTYNTFCSFDSTCDANQTCMNSVCRCKPNYKYIYTTQKCEYFRCEFANECRVDDINRICSSVGSCVCANGYTEDAHRVCAKQSSTSNYNTVCTSDLYCDANQDCISNICKCKPNYKYNYTTQKCEYFRCQYYSECQTDDTNRICNSYGSCVCANGYSEDSNGVCKKQTYSTFCTYNFNCDNDQTCLNNFCKCKPNYKYNYNTQKCEYFSCNYYSDCQTDDVSRICSFGSCVCENGYYEDYYKVCQYSYTYYSYSSYSLTWFWVVMIILPIKLAFWGTVFYYRRRRRLLLASTTTLTPLNRNVAVVSNTNPYVKY